MYSMPACCDLTLTSSAKVSLFPRSFSSWSSMTLPELLCLWSLLPLLGLLPPPLLAEVSGLLPLSSPACREGTCYTRTNATHFWQASASRSIFARVSRITYNIQIVNIQRWSLDLAEAPLQSPDSLVLLLTSPSSMSAHFMTRYTGIRLFNKHHWWIQNVGHSTYVHIYLCLFV